MNLLEQENSASIAPDMRKYLLHRRFDRIARLVGEDAMKALFDSHVMVIGLGGVGSWCAESLARSGVGKLTLIDFDEICVTNTNRQLHAMQGFVGEKKVEVMAQRLRKINPQSAVEAIPAFYNEETSEEILSRKPRLIVDAIDNLTAKCFLLNRCRELDVPVFTSGGSGSRMDPTQIQVADLADTHSDPLSHSVRRILRQKYAWPSEGTPFGVLSVFSAEAPIDPKDLAYDGGKGFKCVCPGVNNLHSCDNRSVIHGTASFVTGTFGLVLASQAVKFLTTPTT